MSMLMPIDKTKRSISSDSFLIERRSTEANRVSGGPEQDWTGTFGSRPVLYGYRQNLAMEEVLEEEAQLEEAQLEAIRVEDLEESAVNDCVVSEQRE